jgi:hypothetical protein
MLSPGEYVMPRSAVNSDTKTILDYIRATGSAPRGYAEGGLVHSIPLEALPINWALLSASWGDLDPLKNTPMSDLRHRAELAGALYERTDPGAIDVVSGKSAKEMQYIYSGILLGYEDGRPIFYSPTLTAPTLGPYGQIEYQNGKAANQIAYGEGKIAGGRGGLFGVIQDVINWLPFGQEIQNFLYYSGPVGQFWAFAEGQGWISKVRGQELRQNTNDLAALIGMLYLSYSASGAISGAGGGYSAGTAASIEEMMSTTGMSLQQLVDAGILTAADVAAYATGVGGLQGLYAALMNVGDSLTYWSTLGEILKEMGTSFIFNKLEGEIVGQFLNMAQSQFFGSGVGGHADYAFEGMTGGSSLGMLGNLNGIIGSGGTIPNASRGIDYIPRDNYLVNTHEGEAIITKEENKRRRGGSHSSDGASQPLFINIPVMLNGRQIAKVVYDESKHGRKTTHTRGVTKI